MALNWNDIVDDTVTISKTLGYHTLNGGYNITSTKTASSYRRILLPNNLVLLLGELRKYYENYELFSNDNFVFGNLKPIPPETARGRLKRYCKKSWSKIYKDS